jgi:hypothetical protein
LELKHRKIIGIIFLLIGIEGLIAGFLMIHLVLNPFINLILIAAGAYLTFKKGAEK